MTAKTREKWERQASEAHAAIRHIEATERDQKHAALIGKCLRYRNSYGHDEKWWLYCKVLRAEGGNLIIHRFETTSRGEIKIEPEYKDYYGLTGGWETISDGTFADAWADLRNRIASFVC